MQRVLTGITTTGTPHLGNYVGAIRPAVAASRQPDTESFLFLADYHALVKCDEPSRVARSRLEIAATWLAAGLDPERAVFYRQSDIPEIPELAWLLSCVAAKGLLNRAHAYKAAVDANLAAGEDPDAGISMGLYGYPVLMAADILVFNAHQVPVGRDQVQHIEMARDFAQRFNHLFGAGVELFTLPEALTEVQVATLPGLDGRKMSKSYDNTVPLFEGGARATLDAIKRIVTDSRLPGEPKDPQGTALLTIFEAFAGAEESRAFADDLRAGLGWGEAKQRLASRIEQDLAPMRERYATLIERPDDIEDILRCGAERARAVATPFLARLREAVGLGKLGRARRRHAGSDAPRASLPQFKQYRDSDGRFYFKLLDGEGRLLAQSGGYAQPREAGKAIAALRAEPGKAAQQGLQLGAGIDETTLRAALARLG
jgi:tryptophanyl-tRNA synthetase